MITRVQKNLYVLWSTAILIGLPKYLVYISCKWFKIRVLCRIGKYDNITEVTSLVASGIKYKICLLTFNSLHGHGPEYISEMLIT